jgi:hypothetical protein
MKFNFPSRFLVLFAGLVVTGPALSAQQLFGPIYERLSPGSANADTPYTFGSTALSLTCPAGKTLALQGPGGGNLLVDNNIIVTVTQGALSSGPQNVCYNGFVYAFAGEPLFTNHCFNPNGNWPADHQAILAQNPAVNPDTLAATYGIPQVDLTPLLSSQTFNRNKPLIVTISLEDEGIVLVASTINMSTTCTFNGVTGPATLGGTPISGSGNQGTSQDFNFDTTDNKNVGFGYDVTGALPNIIDNGEGSIPQVSDLPIDPAQFRPVYVPGTSFATSSCLIHTGELGSDGITPACKLYTLECLSPHDGSVKGANCPVSSQINEVVQDLFDGPPFTLPNIQTKAGVIHEGIGFLMASEDWPGNGTNCTFDTASRLQNLPCPLNLLTSFTGPGGFQGTGLTANPNSEFITVYGVPEDLTTVTITGKNSGNWVKTPTPTITFNTRAPNLIASNSGNSQYPYISQGNDKVSVPGAVNYVPQPIKSITFGFSPANNVPNPVNEATLLDTVLNNTATNCPTGPIPLIVQPNFAPPSQTVSLLDGQYALHYYAQDCAGTQELNFTMAPGTGVWSTNFYTVPLNVDTKPPTVMITSPASGGVYTKGQVVQVTYNCTDPNTVQGGLNTGSGLVTCGTHNYSVGTTFTTGNLQTSFVAGTSGKFTINVVDGAGNTNSVTINYTAN